jgi:hypothetical protein
LEGAVGIILDISRVRSLKEMKNILKTLTLSIGLLAVVGCQKVPDATSANDKPFVATAPEGNDIKLCTGDNAGTLNCYIKFPAETSTFSSQNFNISYDSCMGSCLATPNCTTQVLSAALTSCPAAYSACDSKCNLISGNSPMADLPPSDGLALPLNPKAVKVEITGCYDAGRVTEVHFEGNNVRFETPIEGERTDQVGGGFNGVGVLTGGLFSAPSEAHIKLGYAVGRNPACGIGDMKNKLTVNYTPVKETQVTLGSKNVTVVPFTDLEPFTQNVKLPSTVSFGFPKKLRDAVILNEVVWVPSDIGQPASHMGLFHDFRYYDNGRSYGDSVVFLAPYFSFPLLGNASGSGQKFTMYVFFPSEEN